MLRFAIAILLFFIFFFMHHSLILQPFYLWSQASLHLFRFKRKTAHIHTNTCQDREEETNEEVSDTAECSWSTQASLEDSNSQEKR